MKPLLSRNVDIFLNKFLILPLHGCPQNRLTSSSKSFTYLISLTWESFIQGFLPEFYYVPGTLISTENRELVKAASDSEVLTV